MQRIQCSMAALFGAGFLLSPLSVKAYTFVEDPANTVFLAHYDGNTGSAGRDADYVPNGNPVPTVLRGQTETAQAKFGPQSLNPVFANNPGQRLQYGTQGVFNNPAGTAFALPKGTVETWVFRYASQSNFTQLGIFGTWDATSDIRMQVSSGGQLQATMSNFPQPNTTGWTLGTNIAGGVGTLIPAGAWSHIAWTWDFTANGGNGASALWVNGAVVANTPTFFGTDTKLSDYNLKADPTFQIGSIQNGSFPLPADSANNAAMYLDDFRISNVARYTADFSNNLQSAAWPSAVPEPASLSALLAIGLLAARRRS